MPWADLERKSLSNLDVVVIEQISSGTRKPSFKAVYPEWLSSYKFKGASFPQGRSILSLHV